MVSETDDKVTIESFRGLYNRGNVDDVPPQYAQDCLNLRFTSEGHVSTRDGLTKSITLGHAGGIRRFFLMTVTPPNIDQPAPATAGANLLSLDNLGNLYVGDSATPLYSNSGMADFCALNLGNRVYVSPNNGATGFRSGRLQVFNPFDGIIRDAAGLAPAQSSDFLAATAAATEGVVPEGVHKLVVIYETDTGFWTPPGPKKIASCVPAAPASDTEPTIFTLVSHGMESGESHKISGGTGAWASVNDIWHIDRIDDDTFSIPLDSSTYGAPSGAIEIHGMVMEASVTVDGTTKIAISNIPIGPSYVKKRIILATRADENEFFFVPNKPGCLSEISDNTTTTAEIDFEDTDLVASADYLFDNLEVIPGGGGIGKYRGRVVIAGPYYPGNGERVILSDVDDPESFNYVTGFIQVQSERDGNNVNNNFTLRDTLYLAKFTGLFAVEDNGREPSTWARPSTVDAVIGCYGYGTSSFTASQPSPDTGDIILIASKPGLYIFDGVIRRPELSYVIQDIWSRINFVAFARVTVTHDPWNHLIYISCPLDAATEPNTLLVCDYGDGRDAEKVRWSIYSFPVAPSCIAMMFFGTSSGTTKYTLKIGSIINNNLYELTAGQTSDDGTIIVSFLTPGPFEIVKGAVNVFKLINYRAKGVGHINMTLTKEDGVGAVTPPLLNLSASPGRNLQRQINFVNEKMNLKIRNGDTLGDKMTLSSLIVWGCMQWPVRPGV